MSLPKLSLLQQKLGLRFKNPRLLKTALVHRSYLNETKQKNLQSNERLEYLGDAVLELVVSHYLFQKYPKKPEGFLTKLRAKAVQTQTLAHVAQNLHLDRFLLVSKGERKAGGTHNPSLLADCFEAVTGAIFLDQGLPAARRFIHRHLLKNLSQLLKNSQIIDYKSQLQELVQANHQPTPTYRLVRSFGPDHAKTFESAVFVGRKKLATGRGKSKQQAEQHAAKKAIEKIKKTC